MNHPKVTVLMPVYNGGRFLREAVDSILKQTYRNFEFIVINDGSTDNTCDILRTYSDSRLFVFEQKNLGIIASLNKGIKLSQGEYIARMDADDISEPDRLAKQVEFLDNHPAIGVLGIISKIIDEQANELPKLNLPTNHKNILARLLLDNCFVHSSIMLRKNLFETHGYYSKNAILCEDYELFLRLSCVTQLANLPMPLHRYRMNYSTGISIVKRSKQKEMRDQIRRAFIEKHCSIDKTFIEQILGNYKYNPSDPILHEYINKVWKMAPFFPGYIIRLKFIYYFYKIKHSLLSFIKNHA